MPIDDAQLVAWEALAAAATEGPWEAKGDDIGVSEIRNNRLRWDVLYRAREHDEICGWDDADFICAARTAMPALCKEVRRLRAALHDRCNFILGQQAWLAGKLLVERHMVSPHMDGKHGYSYRVTAPGMSPRSSMDPKALLDSLFDAMKGEGR